MKLRLALALLILLASILASILFLCFNVPHAKVSGVSGTEWNKTYQRLNNEEAFSVVQTSDGGYALAGFTISYGLSTEAWLVKTDVAGNQEWNKTYGGYEADCAYSVVQTSDGGYALAGFTGSFGAGESDFWLVKTDAAGNLQWNKTYGGNNTDEAYSVVQTSDGGYALAGRTRSFVAGSYDSWNFWLVKTDAAGNQQWDKTYGGTDYDYAKSVVQTSDGGYALAGYTHSLGTLGLSDDFLLVKTDAAGNLQWNKTYGGYNTDQACSFVQTSDGGYALLGWTYSFGAGSFDFWLVKTDAAGNQQWDKTYGGTESEWAKSVVQTSDGGYALAGTTRSFVNRGMVFWLVKASNLPPAQSDQSPRALSPFSSQSKSPSEISYAFSASVMFGVVATISILVFWLRRRTIESGSARHLIVDYNVTNTPASALCTAASGAQKMCKQGNSQTETELQRGPQDGGVCHKHSRTIGGKPNHCMEPAKKENMFLTS